MGITPEMINQDLANRKNPGQTILEVSQALAAQAYAQAKAEAEAGYLARYQELQVQVDAGRRQSELQKIAENDPWVFSPDGIEKLGAIRQAKPWLNNAPEPWTEAYKVYKAEQVLRSPSTVQTPNPLAQAVRAPATPVSASNRNAPQMPSLAALSQDRGALNALLDKMPPEQQAAFWRAAVPGAK